jgi:thymidylate kinase
MACVCVFSGLDGAGKSTQIGLILARFEAAGISARCVWIRGGYTPGFEWLKRTLRRLKSGALPAPGRSAERQQRFRSPHVRRLWLVIALCDLAALVGWIRCLLLFGRTVVADRYLEDTLLDFQLNFPEEDVRRWWLWRFVCGVAPSPNHSFVFIIPVAESLRRSQLKQEPFPDSPEVLAARLAGYQRLLAQGGFHEMDGLQPREVLHDRICRICGLAA